MANHIIPPHGGYRNLLSFQEGGLRERMTRARLQQRAKDIRGVIP